MNQDKLIRSSVYVLIIILICAQCIAQGVGIGTATPNNAAMLDVQSTSKGMLIPRMTSAQRAAINPAPAGLLVFDNTTGSFWFKGANSWIELVDTANNALKENGTHVYFGNSGNVGIGTSNPTHDLYISKSAPSIGFSDAGKNHFAGSIVGDSTDLIINAYRKSLGSNTAGNLLLQVGNGGIPPAIAGNVGIGVTLPDTKLHIVGGSNIGTSTGGYLQLGASNTTNMAFDPNEIQGRNDGVAAKIFMQTKGGGLQIGGTNPINITSTGQLYRALPVSSNADLLPVAYGKVSEAGVVLSGTGNFSVIREDEGQYRVLLLAEGNIYANRNSYTVLVSATSTLPMFITSEITSDNSIRVNTAKPVVHYENSGCGCAILSYITNFQFYDYLDNGFSIIVYKQ